MHYNLHSHLDIWSNRRFFCTVILWTGYGLHSKGITYVPVKNCSVVLSAFICSVSITISASSTVRSCIVVSSILTLDECSVSKLLINFDPHKEVSVSHVLGNPIHFFFEKWKKSEEIYMGRCSKFGKPKY